MPHRHWFRQRIVAAAGSTGTDDLTFGPVQHDRHYHLTRFAVEDETTAPSTDIRVFVTGPGYNHLLLEQNSPAAAPLYWDDQGTFLSQGESLVARFVGATAADRLVLYLEGWWVEPVEGNPDAWMLTPAPEVT